MVTKVLIVDGREKKSIKLKGDNLMKQLLEVIEVSILVILAGYNEYSFELEI